MGPIMRADFRAAPALSPQPRGPPSLTFPPTHTHPFPLWQTLDIMKRAYKNRTTFATDMNAHSSRSHALLSVYISGTNRALNVAQRGKLHLVDLAG